MPLKFLVTGGAGFIGSAVVRWIVEKTPHTVHVYDKLTYAGSLAPLAAARGNPRYGFEKGDICDAAAVASVFQRVEPDIVLHLAAESHVDRSIDAPGVFIQTNVAGTQVMLDAALRRWRALTGEAAARFRFHHVSTDEVFGALGPQGRFTEDTPYAPNSPYAASKASSDHLVRAWRNTYGLPTLVTNSSNNYGPWQHPEKFIPLMIANALEGRPLPVYGAGTNVRDWLHVEDHAEALLRVAEAGRAGETYLIGGDAERRNIDVAHAICDMLDEIAPRAAATPRRALIRHVEDRPGHDLRYATDCAKIRRELGWRPRASFDEGLRDTLRWSLANRGWREGNGKEETGERLGLAAQGARA